MNKTLRRVRLVVDDVGLGGFVRLDERPEGLAFVGDGAVRIIAGGGVPSSPATGLSERWSS